MSGEATVPMYKLEIRNQKGKVIKTYQTDGIYILNAAFDEDMITLERASKMGTPILQQLRIILRTMNRRRKAILHWRHMRQI